MSRDKIIPAVYMILNKGGKYLFLRRFNTGYEDGSYSLVAGHIDAGETPIEAAIRELQEEIGVKANAEDVEMKHIMFCKEGKGDRVHCFVEIKNWEGEIVNKEPSKCDDLRWCELNEFPSNLLKDVELALSKINDNHFYSEYIFN